MKGLGRQSKGDQSTGQDRRSKHGSGAHNVCSDSLSMASCKHWQLTPVLKPSQWLLNVDGEVVVTLEEEASFREVGEMS